MLAVSTFFGSLKYFDYNTVYQSREITAHKTYCVLDEKSPTSFKMAMFQQLGGYQSRFVSIKSETDGIVLSATSFENRRDYYFHDQFVLPSDSVPDMLRGGIRRFGFSAQPDETLEGEKRAWSGDSCKKYYGLVAVADRLFDHLAGSRVNNKEIAWTISKNFEATYPLGNGKSKRSHLRVFFFHEKADVVIMGFNRQSLTVSVGQWFKRIHEVDKKSLWKIPSKPQERDPLYYETEETGYFAGLDCKFIYAQASIQYKAAPPFGRIQGMHKFALIKNLGSKTEVVSTPQMTPSYGYQYWIFNYLITLPDRFHPDFKGWAFVSGPRPYWFLFGNDHVRLAEKSEGVTKFLETNYRVKMSDSILKNLSTKENFDKVNKIWKSLIGSKCRKTDGEEVYVAPDYQLLSYEGEYSYTKLILNNMVPSLENCRFL
jgi:hypothetical protein